MAVGRRELMLGPLGMGLALAAGPRPARAEEGEIPQPCLGTAIRPQRCKTPLIKPQSPARHSSCRPATT